MPLVLMVNPLGELTLKLMPLAGRHKDFILRIKIVDHRRNRAAYLFQSRVVEIRRASLV